MDQGIQYVRNLVGKPVPLSVKKVSKRAAAILKLRKSRENSFSMEDPRFQDSYAGKRDYQLIDLRTPDDTSQTRYNFLVKAKFENHSPIMVELDTASQLSLITRQYYEDVISKGNHEFLSGPHQVF